MNQRPDDDLDEWDAAYVLGALSLEERRTYESYLADNPTRSAELTELAGMPGILNALSRDEAVALTDLAGAAPVDRRPMKSRRWRRRRPSGSGNPDAPSLPRLSRPRPRC